MKSDVQMTKVQKRLRATMIGGAILIAMLVAAGCGNATAEKIGERVLANEMFVQAMISLAVVIAAYVANWLKHRFNRIDLVNDNWTYVKPAVTLAIDLARDAIRAKTNDTESMQRVVTAALARFVQEFTMYEAAEPSLPLLTAVSDEIQQAVNRVKEGA